jgi:hypothetical protein
MWLGKGREESIAIDIVKVLAVVPSSEQLSRWEVVQVVL